MASGDGGDHVVSIPGNHSSLTAAGAFVLPCLSGLKC